MNGIRIKILAALKSGLFSNTRLPVLAVVGFVILTPALQRTAGAQGSRTLIKPTATLTAKAAVSRTPEEIDQAKTSMGPVQPGTVVPSFRPTTDASSYQAAKQAVATGATARPATSAPAPLAPPALAGVNFNGVAEGTSCQPFVCAPPDTHGAVGLNNFVEITNSRISIYTKAGTLVKSMSLNAFFGIPSSAATFLFDPRVVYDRTWDRWVITADQLNTTSTEQFFFIAASKTGNPAGAFFKYEVDMDIFDNGDIFDYPQVGLDQDAVIFTGNVFNSSDVFQYAEMFAVAKARLYNGLGFSVPIFTGLDGTLAPPIVLDDSSNTFLVAAPPAVGGTAITKYTLTNSSRSFDAGLVASTITVDSYTIPQNASQPGTAAVSIRSTRDSSTQARRLVIRSGTCTLSMLMGFFPHPVSMNSTFDTDADTVLQSGLFFASGSSHDWNASIAVNDLGEAFVTWSSTDPANSINARVMFSGRESGDAAGSMNAAPGGTVLFTSPTFYTNFRWGDYSAVTLDPKAYSITGGTCDAGRRAWIVNEKINSQTIWGSRIGRIGFC